MADLQEDMKGSKLCQWFLASKLRSPTPRARLMSNAIQFIPLISDSSGTATIMLVIQLMPMESGITPLCHCGQYRKQFISLWHIHFCLNFGLIDELKSRRQYDSKYVARCIMCYSSL